ncbi:unnamed protein product [Adineta steineri]|uniref:Uncharacterized protein n=1 Tax=Adineta steineri TaxID=433720 RepID=A0A814M5R8_9BILA|nr:unnamed protein product [Adineta steineri]CAF3511335.1 unnamed protein product [Adineta steineri]
MLLTILARMSNDEQRLQLLQTLRNKLSNYNLDWLDIRNILNLFSEKNQIRFKILQLILLYKKNFINKLSINDYIDLSNQCTNNNEQLKIQLFEQIYDKLNIQNKNDVENIISLFHTVNIKQKIEAMIRFEDKYEEINGLSTLHPEEIMVNNILSPTLSSIEELSLAPLKRKHSFDNEYQDQSCHQIITPLLIQQQDEFIQQQDLLTSISISSSNSSFSSSSASDENIPIRTRSFMIAIKNTFERLKETSS